MRKKLAKNAAASLIYQVSTILCGFIVPQFILNYYGSEVNGLISSITQFLQIIAFLELGVGAVIMSSLYKPLAERKYNQISAIHKSSSKFFLRIAQILLVYVTILLFIYPMFVNQDFDLIYTGTLILSMSISSFAQYYFGIVNGLLLRADQRAYIQYNVQTITLFLNTVCVLFLISNGVSIQIVKLTTSLIYLLRPIYLKFYVSKNYSIDKTVTYPEEPIKQKWNGIAQHIAAVVLSSTDIIVLTIFSTLSNVSIYAVHYMVVTGIKSLFIALTSGIQPLIGNLWAKRELEKLEDFFSWGEWSIHTGATFLFSCTAVLIVPFISIYTNGITDTNYFQPLFAYLLVIANASYCFRIPYSLMILAAGHYKQTQNNYIIAALLNILISIILVINYGIIGVAIGTLVAMLYQTTWMAYYGSRNLIKWPFRNFLKQMAINILTSICIGTITKFYKINTESYFSWSIDACIIFLYATFIILAINLIFYKSKVNRFFSRLTNSTQN